MNNQDGKRFGGTRPRGCVRIGVALLAGLLWMGSLHTAAGKHAASDSLRARNVVFNSPVCTPSRQAILTGRYPHAVGVTLLRTALSDTTTTLAEHLRQQGCATGAVPSSPSWNR